MSREPRREHARVPSRIGFPLNRKILGLGAVLLIQAFQASAQSLPNGCGSLANAFGPFDYRPDHYRAAPDDREPHAQKLFLVESAHFGPIVEQLRGGMTTNRPGHDLDYTLRAFPNHPRALMAVLRLWERDRQSKQTSTVRPAECYFERAIRFQPNDTIPRMLYARFLLKDQRQPEAVTQLNWVSERASDNPFTHYNLGLTYLEAKMFDEALRHAHKALELGLQDRGLAQQLQAVGRWKEPESVAQGTQAAGAAPAPPPATPKPGE